MINTVAQEVLGRNRSLSVDGSDPQTVLIIKQMLRSARTCARYRKYKP